MGTQLCMPDVVLALDEDVPPTTRSPETIPERKPRGFAAMDPAKVAEIASKGGVAAHAKGTAHKWTTTEARAAGSKGGRAAHRTRGKTRP